MKLLSDYYINELKDVPYNDMNHFIMAQNDKYFKCSYNNGFFWNILDLLELQYFTDENINILTSKIITNQKVYKNSIIESIDGSKSIFKEIIKPKIKSVCLINDIHGEYSIKVPKIKILKPSESIEIKFNHDNTIIECRNFSYSMNLESLTYYIHKTLILDFRNNMGGSIKNGIIFLSYFLDNDQNLFYLKSKKETYSVKSVNNPKIRFNDLIIYYNERTLSTAELVIKVLVSNFEVLLVGIQSGGKDVVTNTIEYNKMFFKIPQYKYFLDNELDRYPYIISNNVTYLSKEKVDD